MRQTKKNTRNSYKNTNGTNLTLLMIKYQIFFSNLKITNIIEQHPSHPDRINLHRRKIIALRLSSRQIRLFTPFPRRLAENLTNDFTTEEIVNRKRTLDWSQAFEMIHQSSVCVLLWKIRIGAASIRLFRGEFFSQNGIFGFIEGDAYRKRRVAWSGKPLHACEWSPRRCERRAGS